VTESIISRNSITGDAVSHPPGVSLLRRVHRPRTADPDAPYALCGSPSAGFTLLEVMIAMFVFFIVVFAVLGLVVQSLGAARALQIHRPDAGMVAAMVFMSGTNLEDGATDSGDFEELSFPDYMWDWESTEIGSNGLYRVDIAVSEKGKQGKQVRDTLVIYKYEPKRPGQQVRRR
jgi:hypothetical protein